MLALMICALMVAGSAIRSAVWKSHWDATRNATWAALIAAHNERKPS